MRKLKTIELKRLSVEEYHQTIKNPLVVLLDNVRSAYNVGSVFRTADAFGVQEIVLCGISPCPPHKEIYKTAIGAENSVKWTYEEKIIDSVVRLKTEGYAVVGVEQTSNSISLQDYKWEKGTKFALILGNEVDGISDEILELCDCFIEIPQFGTKHSLNVSVAAGVVIWDLVKKITYEK